MIGRRNIFKALLATSLAAALPATRTNAQTPPEDGPVPARHTDRSEWCALAYRIAQPVLSNLANGTLRKNMPVEVSPIWDGRDKAVAYMECFGRLISGISPWLILPDDDTDEGRQRRRLRQWALESYANTVDPKSPDYLLWRKEGQPLVDSAYYSNALIRARKQLWTPLDKVTKARIVDELKRLRRVSPPYTNWLLFAAMNEAFLLSAGEEYDPERINLAIKKIDEWYVGDGWYSDGVRFHYDYYNAFVIHPMLLEILEVLIQTGTSVGDTPTRELHEKALKRCQRYAAILERMISPEGTFPPIGRSLTYRSAVFQPLALMAWRKTLPEGIGEGQVRAALSAVHNRIFSSPDNFTADNFLTIGFAGHRPEIADIYSNNGSMYVTTESFLALGLPQDDSFWTAPAADWTAKKAFANHTFERDHAVPY